MIVQIWLLFRLQDFVLSPDPIVDRKRKSKMNPTRPLVIHKLLPSEIMGVIFEEHAKLEWKAPAIDGRVCRRWRQIVLNTPRAWIYLEISDKMLPRIRELREWLDRSGSAPLHIRVDNKPTPFDYDLYERSLHGMLNEYHTRLASLRLPASNPLFFMGRDFPCLQLLDVVRWDSGGSPECPVRWDSMPALRSLRLASTEDFPLQWSGLPPLEALTLYGAELTSLPQHSQSLTTLMLESVSAWGISSPITFPSLTYLSLNNVTGLKPYIDAPCLATYHEWWFQESFSSPVPSLVEYGVFYPPTDDANPARWHHSFPNMTRLSIRAPPLTLVSFFRSLSHNPQSLPAVQTICAIAEPVEFTEEDQEIIKDLVRVREEACQTHAIVYFETEKPREIPIYFAEVSHCISDGF
jgi:hypothetical protein